jgi:acyl-CoA synthetase (AMP-forming)/AMP-acid ligase II
VAAAGPAAAATTVVQCVPAVLDDVLDGHAAGLLPALRTAVVAGAPSTARLRQRTAAAGLRLVEYYGAAELSFVAIDDDGHGLRPFPGAELAVRDDVVWVRSPYVGNGYLDPGDPGPLRRDQDGWHTVGDRGAVDDGRLILRGRGGESVSVGGHTVVVGDVESALAGVAGVLELAVVGEPHARLGERVVLAVRAQDGCDPLPALRAAARTALPPAARPVRYVLVGDLPRTAGGKVSRAALRELVTWTGRRTAARRTPGPASAAGD